MKFKCPKCQTPLSVPDTSASKVIACPKCSSKLRVPVAKTRPVEGAPVSTRAAHGQAAHQSAQPQQPAGGGDPFGDLNDPFGDLNDPLANPLGVPVAPSVPMASRGKGSLGKRKRKKSNSGIPLAWILGGSAIAAVVVIGLGVVLWMTLMSGGDGGRARFSELMPRLEFDPAVGSTHTYDIVLTTINPKTTIELEVTYDVKEGRNGKMLSYTARQTGGKFEGIGSENAMNVATTESDEFLLSTNGATSDHDTEMIFPFWIGSVPTVPFIPMSGQSLDRWSFRERAYLNLPTSPNGFGGGSQAVEFVFDYRISDRNSRTVTIAETREIKPSVSAFSTLKWNAKGSYVFDLKLGLLTSGKQEGKIVLFEREDQREIEFLLEYKRR